MFSTQVSILAVYLKSLPTALVLTLKEPHPNDSCAPACMCTCAVNEPHPIREGGAISSAGQCRLMHANFFLHGVSVELRITSALPILGGHRMALGCSGLHANGCFNACRNYPAPKNLCRNSPALP